MADEEDVSIPAPEFFSYINNAIAMILIKLDIHNTQDTVDEIQADISPELVTDTREIMFKVAVERYIRSKLGVQISQHTHHSCVYVNGEVSLLRQTMLKT